MKRWQLVAMFAVAGLAAFGLTYFMGQQRQAQESKTIHVALRDDVADRQVVSVKVGQYIEFDSKDGKSHSLTQGDPPTSGEVTHHTASGNESSGEFKADEGWRVQFNKPGTYNFYDELNPKIRITVVAYQTKK